MAKTLKRCCTCSRWPLSGRFGQDKTISQSTTFILHTDTLIESPEVWAGWRIRKLAALERFIAKENLPLTVAGKAGDHAVDWLHPDGGAIANFHR